MKPIRLAVYVSAGAVVLAILSILYSPSGPSDPIDPIGRFQPGQGCSVIYATDGEVVLAGNNEDYLDPLTRVWFIPAENGSFGKVYFGFENYHAQGGMNDQGLFFDALALDEAYPVLTAGKQAYPGNLVDKIMSECGTVDCAVELFGQYYTSEVWYWQFFFGDASGSSAIVEPQTVIEQQGSYQVSTNFLQSDIAPEDRTDRRYQTAIQGLESAPVLTVETIRDIMDSIHVDGPSYTLYSNVYDLKNKVVYLYYFHNYDDVVVLDLAEELARGYHAYDLPSLFLPNPEAEAWAEPKVRKYENLIQSRFDETMTREILQAYAGEYEMLEGWGDPNETLRVVAREQSVFLRFPDCHQHELFPVSPTDFYYVAFLGGDFSIAYDVHFGLDENGRVLYLELILGDQALRAGRIGPESFVELTPAASPSPALTNTNTQEPTAAHTITASSSPQPVATETAPAVTATSGVETSPASDTTDAGNIKIMGPIILGVLLLAVAIGVWIVRYQR